MDLLIGSTVSELNQLSIEDFSFKRKLTSLRNIGKDYVAQLNACDEVEDALQLEIKDIFLLIKLLIDLQTYMETAHLASCGLVEQLKQLFTNRLSERSDSLANVWDVLDYAYATCKLRQLPIFNQAWQKCITLPRETGGSNDEKTFILHCSTKQLVALFETADFLDLAEIKGQQLVDSIWYTFIVPWLKSQDNRDSSLDLSVTHLDCGGFRLTLSPTNDQSTSSSDVDFVGNRVTELKEALSVLQSKLLNVEILPNCNLMTMARHSEQFGEAFLSLLKCHLLPDDCSNIDDSRNFLRLTHFLSFCVTSGYLDAIDTDRFKRKHCHGTSRSVLARCRDLFLELGDHLYLHILPSEKSSVSSSCQSYFTTIETPIVKVPGYLVHLRAILLEELGNQIDEEIETLSTQLTGALHSVEDSLDELVFLFDLPSRILELFLILVPNVLSLVWANNLQNICLYYNAAQHLAQLCSLLTGRVREAEQRVVAMLAEVDYQSDGLDWFSKKLTLVSKNAPLLSQSAEAELNKGLRLILDQLNARVAKLNRLRLCETIVEQDRSAETEFWAHLLEVNHFLSTTASQMHVLAHRKRVVRMAGLNEEYLESLLRSALSLDRLSQKGRQLAMRCLLEAEQCVRQNMLEVAADGGACELMSSRECSSERHSSFKVEKHVPALGRIACCRRLLQTEIVEAWQVTLPQNGDPSDGELTPDEIHRLARITFGKEAKIDHIVSRSV